MGSESQSASPTSPATPSAITTGHKAARNILNVVLGDTLFKTWYPSLYPEELVGRETETLHICPWCFKYSKELIPLVAHLNVCHARSEGPPGTLIYTKSPYSIYEVDGEEHKLFTQNLSLFAKLFLDNKSVFFDVSSFNYYLLVQEPTPSSSDHPQIVGFFSKEKMSWDNNNLACILVFPPWQRQGLGKILMGISYELSKRERNVGGPEKPLSELGRKGYLKFWEARVASAILGVRNKTTLTVQEIADLCWMVRDDVMIALKEMGFLEPRKRGAAMLVSKGRVRQWASVNGIDLLPPVAVSCFLDDWVPEVLDYTNI